MALTRTEHWATREFHRHLLDHAKAPFVWGENDCCLYPANAIKAFTGVDMAEDFRGKYSDAESAFALIKAVTGGATVADAAAWCAAKHGLHEWVHPLFAQRGDLVVVKQGSDGEDGAAGALIAGIVHLNGLHVVSMGEKGLLRLPIRSVVRAWKV